MIEKDKQLKLYMRADAILDRKANGHALPILWHLAVRGHDVALVRLADVLTQLDGPVRHGRIRNAISPMGMEWRAFKKGDSLAAHNLALSHFNAGNLQGYRHWLHKAARAGDEEAAAELKRFETRLPHTFARRLRRHRPYRRDGS